MPHWPRGDGTGSRSLSTDEERALARDVKRGDEWAFQCLLRGHWEGLVRYGLRFLDRQDEVEDMVQEAFVRLWTHREEWRKEDTLRPILYRIVRNLLLNENRRRKTFRKWAQGISRTERDPRPTPLQEVEGQALEGRIREALDGLPERRREIFILVRFHQMSYREAGKVLDLAPQTVANQMTKAMADLREALSSYFESEHPASPDTASSAEAQLRRSS